MSYKLSANHHVLLIKIFACDESQRQRSKVYPQIQMIKPKDLQTRVSVLNYILFNSCFSEIHRYPKAHSYQPRSGYWRRLFKKESQNTKIKKLSFNYQNGRLY